MNNNPNKAKNPNEIHQRSAAAIQQGKQRRRREASFQIFVTIITVIFVLLAFIPIFLMVFLSLQNQAQFYANLWAIPIPPEWGNYAVAWQDMFQNMINSMVTVAIGTVLVVSLAAMSGYVFARLEFPLKNFLFMLMLALMMLLNGGAGLAFSGHLGVLTRTSGYSAELAASLISLFGLMLIISKLVAGSIADRIGSKQCSILLFLIFIAGCFFVFGMDGSNTFWCFALAIMLGLGASLFNVGPPLWAEDLSSRQQYAKTLKWLQIFYNLGGIIFTVVPGLIADHTHEYKSSFVLFAVMMTLSLLILLWAYRKRAALAPME